MNLCRKGVILKRLTKTDSVFVGNWANIGVIGKLLGANAGFYDQIRIYCM